MAGPTSSSFHTLDREHAFSHPSTSHAKYAAIHALVAPHIQSFDALFEGAPMGPNGEVQAKKGLLDMAVEDLSSKVIFDGKTEEGLGNRLESALYELRRDPS